MINEDEKQKIIEDIKKEIDQYIKKKNPDLLLNFTCIYQELLLCMKEFDGTLKFIEKKMKKLIDNTAIFETLHLMKEDLQDMKTMIRIANKLEEKKDKNKTFT